MKFKKITKRTRITFPCVLARRETWGWEASVSDSNDSVDLWRSYSTHWAPFDWPAVS